MAPLHQLLPLPQLLPAGARGFAVIDLETTGTGQLCRIVEIALLLLSTEGEIEREWSTVINPGVPIPNAAVHGIEETLAGQAPSFSTVAPPLAAMLEGRVLVAHNLDRFDGPILRHHFWEAVDAIPGLVLDLGDGIDTMPNPFLGLGKLCTAHGISLSGDDPHTALASGRLSHAKGLTAQAIQLMTDTYASGLAGTMLTTALLVGLLGGISLLLLVIGQRQQRDG